MDLIIASGFNKQSNQNVLELSKEYEGFIYPTFGFHPVSSQNSTDEELKDAQNHLIDNLSNIVAVGEVGMDYYYVTDKALRERQQEIFTSFLNLANEYKNHKFYLVNSEDTKIDVLGYAISLSDTTHNKSISFEKVTRIIMDEFIPLPGEHPMVDEIARFENNLSSIIIFYFSIRAICSYFCLSN